LLNIKIGVVKQAFFSKNRTFLNFSSR